VAYCGGGAEQEKFPNGEQGDSLVVIVLFTLASVHSMVRVVWMVVMYDVGATEDFVNSVSFAVPVGVLPVVVLVLGSVMRPSSTLYPFVPSFTYCAACFHGLGCRLGLVPVWPLGSFMLTHPLLEDSHPS